MKLTESKEVTEIKEITIGYKCDICKKVHTGSEYPDWWYEFEHGHQSWGNDSCESIEDFLVCSPECYFKQLKKSLITVEDYCDGNIDHKSSDFIKDLLKYVNDLR